MGIETEMPEAALFVGQRRVHGRVVQVHHAAGRIALVVLADGIDQARSGGRRIALGDDADVLVHRRAQAGQGLFGLALAVKALDHQRAVATRPFHATTGIDPLGGPDQVAVDGFTGVGKWTGQTFDHADTDGLAGGRCFGQRLEKRGWRPAGSRSVRCGASSEKETWRRMISRFNGTARMRQ